MKRRTAFTNSSAILVCCLLLSLSFFVACKKNKKEDATPPVETIKLSIDSTKAFPGQAVIIKVSKRITTTETNIAVGSTIVKGYASGDSSYVFIVPVIASGTFSLSIPAIANSTTVNLIIPAYTAISNPQSIINEYVDKRNKSIDSVTKVVEGSNFQPSPQSIVLLNQIKEEWNLQINNLAAGEKELLAYVLQRNMPDPSQYSFEAMPAGHFAKPSGIQSDVGDALVAIAKQYITAHTICLGSIPFLVASGYAFIAAPNPVSALIFLGVFTTFVISREIAIRRAQEVGRLKGVAEEITESDAQRMAADFFNNTEKTLNMQVGFRNLSTADASIHPDIAAAFSGEQSLAGKDREVEAVYAKATAKTTKLKGAYPSYTAAIGKQAKGTTGLPVEGKNIIIKGVSDPRISYTTSISGATRKVKISSTSTGEINFNLQVAYKRTLDGKEFTKNVACTYKAACDPATTTAPVINSYSFGCTAEGRVKIDVSFTAGGEGLLIGSGYGACNQEENCYPVRLYFRSPGATKFEIAANGYGARLASGTVNQGVVEIELYTPRCIAGKSARESFNLNYPNYEWKIELMNTCGTRSAQVQF